MDSDNDLSFRIYNADSGDADDDGDELVSITIDEDIEHINFRYIRRYLLSSTVTLRAGQSYRAVLHNDSTSVGTRLCGFSGPSGATNWYWQWPGVEAANIQHTFRRLTASAVDWLEDDEQMPIIGLIYDQVTPNNTVLVSPPLINSGLVR
jgi:hypothetical protein